MHIRHSHLHKRQEPADGPASGGTSNSNGHHHDGNDGSENGGSVATAVSIIYVTASKDFDGPVVGYSTVGVPGGSSPSQSVSVAEPVPTSQANSQPTSQDTVASPTPASSHVEPTSQAESTSEAEHTSVAATTSNSLLNTVAATSDSADTIATGLAQTPTDSFAAASSTSSPVSPVSSTSSDSGLSSGAKAGIAIGLIALVGLIAGLAFWAIRRKKQANEGHARIEDEKRNPFGDNAAASAPTSPMAHPNGDSAHMPNQSFFGAPAMAGALGGAAVGAGAANASRSNPQPEQPLEKPANPFSEPTQNASQASFTQSIPIGADDNTIPPTTSDTEKAAFGATVAGAALATRPRESPSMQNGPQKPLPPFAAAAVPGSPAASTFSVDSSSSVAMAGALGGPNSQPVVHRVQIDFKGSMHDEIDVRTGELVAIVHEYDDGWVLARRLDKSKQGVCPRSCLSPRPLQPRNRGAPPPGARGPPPPRTASPAPSIRGGPLPNRTASPAPSGPMRSASPAPGSRSASPALNPNMNNWPAKPINASTITPNMNQWPMKPTNASAGKMPSPRSMSPGPYGGGPPQPGKQRPYGPVKRRSNSMGNIIAPRPTVAGFPGADRVTSTGEDIQLPIQSPGSPVARKPVPGQAS